MKDPRASIYGLLCGTVCALVLATHVHAGFERLRFRIVTTPLTASAGAFEISLPDLTRLSGRPAAVVARVRGPAQPAHLSLAFDDGAPFRNVALKPRRSIRIDAAAEPPSGSGRVLRLRSEAAGFVVEYLEIANIHGFTGSPVALLILPRQRAIDPLFPWWVAVAVWVLLLAARPLPDRSSPRWIRRLYGTAAVVILTLFGIVLTSGLFSPFRIAISPGGFAFLTVLLYAQPLARIAIWLRATPLGMAASWRYAPHAAIVGIFVVSVAQFYRPDVGLTSFIQFGEQFQQQAIPEIRNVPHAVETPGGYDGQFYAQLSFDPLLRRAETRLALDDPAYRARRILLPWVASLVGTWGAWWVLQAYAALNIATWGLLAWLLLRWFPVSNPRGTAGWIACMFSHGLVSSVAFALTDGPSVLLIAAAVRALESARHRLATGILAISGLARETNLLGAPALLPAHLRSAGWRRASIQLVVVAAPLSLWLLYLWWIGLSPLGAGARNFAYPLSGYAAKAVVIFDELSVYGWGSFVRLSLLAHIALTTQVLVLVYLRKTDSHWWRIGIAYAALMLVLGPAVWEGHPGAVIRVVLPMTVAFNVLLLRVRPFWPLWLLGNANVVFGFTAIRADHVLPMLRWMQLT